MFDTLKEIWKAVTVLTSPSPSNLYLDKAAMEGTETANVSASGMGLRQRYYNYVERVIILFRVEPFTVEPMLS
jgi:hypothetical protein